MKSFINRSILVLAILLAALFLRLYNLGRESLWLDEVFSIKFAELSLSEIFFLPENNPPLYSIIMHWWILLFGVSEFSVRLPSAIFGFLTVFIMYKVGGKLFNIDVGKLSSLLMAFSAFHILYSQEARTYSLSVLLTLLSMYFFISLLSKVTYRILGGYLLSSILLMYSHIYGLFIIIAQNIYFIVLFLLSREEKLNFKRWMLIQCTLIFLFAPWISVFVSQIREVQKDFWIQSPRISSIIYSFLSYSGSEWLLSLLLTVSSFSLISYENLGGGMDGKYFFKSLESYQWRIRLLDTDKVYFLLTWLITPIVLPFIISLFSQPIYYTRYTIVASMAFYLLAARGIANIHNKYFKSSTIIIFIVLSLIPIWRYHNNINKEEWREVAKYVDAYGRGGDLLLFNASYCMLPFNYYSGSDLLVKKGFPEKNKNVDEENINKLSEAVRGYDRVWVILSHSGDKKELITKKLMKSFRLSHRKDYQDIKLYLFEKGACENSTGVSGYES